MSTPSSAISDETRKLAAWRVQIAKQQVCPDCRSKEIAVVIFGRSHLTSEAALDELFGVGGWVDGGADPRRDLMFQCTGCSKRFGTGKDLFGVFGLPDLSF